MLTDLKIRRFRGIDVGDLNQLTPLVVLTGPNGSGKTSVMEAAYLTHHHDLAESMETLRNRAGQESTLRWLFHRGDREAIEISAMHGETAPLEFVARNQGNSCDVVIEHGSQKITGIFDNQTGQPVSRVEDKRPALMRRCVFADSRVLAANLHQAYSEISTRGNKARLRDILRSCFPNIVGLEILTADGVPTLFCDYGHTSIPLSLAGDGFKSLAAYSIVLALCDRGPCFLEEPECHQYPRTLQHFARATWAAVDAGVQVFLSTHSLELIDLLSEPDRPELSLYRLGLDAGRLKAERYDHGEVRQAREILAEDLR